MQNRVAIIIFIAMLVLESGNRATAAEPSGKPPKFDLPVLVVRPHIEYPYSARRNHITGSGIILIQIDRVTGKVTDARMLQSTGSSILDNAATAGFRGARFKPGTVSQAKIPISFSQGGPPVFEYRVKQKPMDEVLAHFLGKGILRKGPIPKYPGNPPWSEKEGQGLYELHVQKEGTVAEVRILKSSGDAIFDRVAAETLHKWRLARGPLIVVLPLRFKLNHWSYSVDVPEKL